MLVCNYIVNSGLCVYVNVQDVELFVHPSDWVPKQKVTSFSKLDLLPKIKSKLNASQRAIIRSGCFGSIIDLPDNKSATQLMLQLALRQCKTSNSEELTFFIGGKTSFRNQGICCNYWVELQSSANFSSGLWYS